VTEHWLEMEMAWVRMSVCEIEHQSIFINANQYGKQTVNQIEWVSNLSVFLVPQHSFA
jgi:hypothetical protein